ncbi:hypothetical protein ACFL0Q_09350, partial [Thermodesulfobacteriota bacterium]
MEYLEDLLGYWTAYALAVGGFAVGNIPSVCSNIDKGARQDPIRLLREKHNTQVCGDDTVIYVNRQIEIDEQTLKREAIGRKGAPETILIIA